MLPVRPSLAFVLVLFGSALPASLVAAGTAPAPAAKDAAPHYPMRGVVVGVFPEKSTLLVRCEEVPGLLTAGNMAFRVEDAAAVKAARKGQLIVATIIVREDDFWLTDIQLSKR